MSLRISALTALLLAALPSVAMAKDSAPKQKLEWIGFRPSPGGASEVFLVVSHAVAPREVAMGDRLYLIFDNVVPGKSNHLRALDTRFFESTVKWVKAKRIGKRGCKNCEGKGKGPTMTGPGVMVTIAFRANAQTSYDLSQEDTTFDPAEANGPRDGVTPSAKPKAEPRTRRMIRLAFPPPGDNVPIGGSTGPDAMKESTGGRPKLEEPKPGQIVIPPAPSPNP